MNRRFEPHMNLVSTQASRKPYKRVVPSQDSQYDQDIEAPARLPRVVTDLPDIYPSSSQDSSAANVIATKLNDKRAIRRFAVVYAKASTRKHKKWEADGVLVSQGNTLFLKDVNNEITNVASSYNNNSVEMENLGEGLRLNVGQFELEIQNEIYEPECMEFVVMCDVSDLQTLIYAKIEDIKLNEDFHKDYINRLYSHPAVLYLRLQQLKELSPESIPISNLLEEYPDSYNCTSCYVNESGKLETLVNLVEKFDDEHDSTVIVASSINSLDIIEAVFNALDFEVFRLDGKSASIKKAQIDIFNTIELDGEKQSNVLLMHTDTQTIGQSINGANKLVLFDTGCWDKDIKSRVWTNNRAECQVYRLVTENSFEELEFKELSSERDIQVFDIKELLDPNVTLPA